MLEQPVDQFLDALASGAPTPGGGSVSALAGALGAALLSMVGHLTAGKERFVEVDGQVRALLERTEMLRGELAWLSERDSDAYRALSAAYKLPRREDLDRQARSEAIQTALIAATETPMQIAELSRQVLDCCRPLAETGNPNAISDAGVAALLADAALRSAMLNVLVNLKEIKDLTYVDRQRRRLDGLLEGASASRDGTLDFVLEHI